MVWIELGWVGRHGCRDVEQVIQACRVGSRLTPDFGGTLIPRYTLGVSLGRPMVAIQVPCSVIAMETDSNLDGCSRN